MLQVEARLVGTRVLSPSIWLSKAVGSQIGRLRRINWELALKGEFQIGKHDYSYLVVDLQKVYQTLGHKNWPDLFVISALISLPELFLVSTKKGFKKDQNLFEFWDTGHSGQKNCSKTGG